MEEASDGTLLAAFRGGDASALTQLVERHQAVLLRHARSIVGPGGPFEDAVQEAFLRFVQKPPELPAECRGDAQLERSHLLSWLHKVVRNCCMDALRSDKRRRRREEEIAAPEASHGETSALETSDTRAAVERSLNRLPSEQREVLVLRLLAERSYKEIAEITGKKIGTVGWLVSVGLKALSQELAPLIGARDVALAKACAQPVGQNRPTPLGVAQGERS
jgi:RNA polymerase sigma-70 factor (ECF subfamily)